MSYFDRIDNPDLKKSEAKLPNNMGDPAAKNNTAEEVQDLSQTESGKEAGERGAPDLRIKKGKSNVSRFFFAVGAASLIAIVLFSLFGFFSGGDEQPEDTKQEETMIQNNHAQDFAAEQERLRREELERLKQQQAQQQVQQAQQAENQPTTVTTADGKTIIVAAPAEEKEKEPDRRLQGAVTIEVASSNSKPADDGANAPEGQDTVLSNRLVPSIIPATVAKQRKDLTYLLRKGANIHCTLDTMIVTTHPGITRCVVNKDIYSANGKTLLIDRGSEIIGEQTTAMVQGQARVFILWTTIETPQGVSIDINSPASDNLGASGAPAQVDTHFWARFGGAIMLSMIDDVMGITSNRAGNKDYTFDNTQESSRSMAEEALRNTINIPPTGYVNQGTLLNVMVARDVDFSTVYELVKLKRY